MRERTVQNIPFSSRILFGKRARVCGHVAKKKQVSGQKLATRILPVLTSARKRGHETGRMVHYPNSTLLKCQFSVSPAGTNDSFIEETIWKKQVKVAGWWF